MRELASIARAAAKLRRELEIFERNVDTDLADAGWIALDLESAIARAADRALGIEPFDAAAHDRALSACADRILSARAGVVVAPGTRKE